MQGWNWFSRRKNTRLPSALVVKWRCICSVWLLVFYNKTVGWVKSDVLTVKLKLKDHETWITELLYLTLTQPDAPKASDTHLHIYVHTHTHTHTYTKCYLLPFLCHCYRAVINYLSMMSFRSPSPHTVQPSSGCTLAAILASIKSGMDTAKKQSSNADRNSCFVILTTSFL